MSLSATVLKSSWLHLVVAGCVVVVVVLSKYYLAARRPKNYPPGPPTLPFIGNLTQVPRVKAFLKFEQLKSSYGSIIGLKMASQNVVILNHYSHVKALFDQRGAIYSSRPQSHIATTLVCPNQIHLLLLPYGPEWRKQRRILQSLLNINAVDKFLPLQNAEATQTVVDIMHNPNGYYDHIRRYTTAVILASVFGQRAKRFKSKNVQDLYHAQDQFTAILEQGATPPVDAFGFLKYLPGGRWKAWAKEVRREQKGLYMRLLGETRERIGRGKGGDCFLGSILQGQEKNGMDDEHVAYLAGNLMEAGSDTTASTLLSFLLAMIKYPDELRKAQAEVDEVCGPDRSPGPQDIGRLPFVKACMDETLRWRPVASGMIPHMNTQDDTYMGYFFPKGTVFLPNVWAVSMDESEYQDPARFMPDRWLPNEYGTRTTGTDPVTAQEDEATQDFHGGHSGDDHGRRTTYGFGAGRRSCPGHWLAKNSLMLNMAKLAWALDLAPAEGMSPADVDDDISTAYLEGFLIAPKRFPISIKPRSEKHRAVIEAEFEKLTPTWDKYEDMD
ncbi:cytochrome P450 [Rhypophila decipiens]|uniref:Cytochrome P450 n=1 Tax=Rhypophila decipiens TaxID=261697 RepID=A0AAN6YCN2_9PEZI|nr:cytochrome P450 [Rhypophila decipiens]